MTRREKLLRLCEFDENRVYLGAFVKSYQTGHLDGQYSENKKLLPILTALIEENEKLREALEFYANYMEGKNPEFDSNGLQKYPSPDKAKQALAASPLVPF